MLDPGYSFSRTGGMVIVMPGDPGPGGMTVANASASQPAPSIGISQAGSDLVFASEDYGRPLAEVLGGRFVPVDMARAAVPVSGSNWRGPAQT